MDAVNDFQGCESVTVVNHIHSRHCLESLLSMRLDESNELGFPRLLSLGDVILQLGLLGGGQFPVFGGQAPQPLREELAALGIGITADVSTGFAVLLRHKEGIGAGGWADGHGQAFPHQFWACFLGQLHRLYLLRRITDFSLIPYRIKVRIEQES